MGNIINTEGGNYILDTLLDNDSLISLDLSTFPYNIDKNRIIDSVLKAIEERLAKNEHKTN